MDVLSAGSADNLFAATGDNAGQMETLATQALNTGIDQYQKKDYAAAAKSFQQAFRLSPYSTYAYDATRYASMAFQSLGEPKAAIKAYEQAIQANQTDDRLYLDLGNLLYRQERTGEAIEAYETAVRLYDDPANRYALGQGYLKAGRHRDAERQFNNIIERGGAQSRNGYFGLGQTLRDQKKYDEAIEQFERAIQMDRDFYNAYEEMGYTYADAGRMEEADRIHDLLKDKDEGLAALLDGYIGKATKPRLMFAYADSSFPYYHKPNTALSVLDQYLANADAGKTFTMEFQFNKEMDRESIENITNWTIERSTEPRPGMNYNFGLGTPDTEVNPPLYPTSVYYDEKKMSAVVRFTLTQNENADGTIDPSHIVFSFNGKDADGNAMDTEYDQFMGFSKSF